MISCFFAILLCCFSLQARESICLSLKGISYAEETGLVSNVSKVYLEGVEGPYNATFVEEGDGYLMVFRYDLRAPSMTTPFREKIPVSALKEKWRTFLGAVRLDEHFQQVSDVMRIETGSDFSEDPRLFWKGDQLYLLYNDLEDLPVYVRSMRLAKLDPKSLTLGCITDLDQRIAHVDRLVHMEKNWTPFVSQEEESRICFRYSINPHKILRMKSPQSEEMEHPIYPLAVSFKKLPWDEKKWGSLRGGTPAIFLEEGVYLSFFHTMFRDGGTWWYLMGAYTFQAEPPYQILSVSKEPLLLKEIYLAPPRLSKKILFPSGIVRKRDGDLDVFHVSCGANDQKILILTIEKKALMQSLVSTID